MRREKTNNYGSFYQNTEESIEELLDALEEDNVTLHKQVWDPACGKGNIAKVLIRRGYNVLSSDVKDYGYGTVEDFTKTRFKYPDMDIICWPPAKVLRGFLWKALTLSGSEDKIIFNLPIAALKGRVYQKLFQEYPPMYVYITPGPQEVIGEDGIELHSMCWCIWQRGYEGETYLRFYKGD